MTQQTGAAGGRIIDLGDLEPPKPVEQPAPQEEPMQPTEDVQPAQEQRGRIINLEGEGFIDPEDVPQAPSPDEFVLDQLPESEVQMMTPEEAAELPEINYLAAKLNKTGADAEAFRLGLGMMTTADDLQLMDIVQNALPDARVYTLENGSTIVDYEDEQFILNKPGISKTDGTRLLGQFLAFIPAGRAAIFGREAVKRTGTVAAMRPIAQSAAAQRAGQVALGGVASAATSAGLDAASAQLADGIQEGDISGSRAALAGIFGGGAELLGPAFRGIVRKFKGTPDDLKYIDLEEVAELRQIADEFGVQIFEPQATQARADSLYMRILQDLPETQRDMMALLHRQNSEASGAVMDFIADIGDKQSIVNAPQRVRDAAVQAIDGMKEARRNLTSQAYNEAFAAGTTVPIQSTLDTIDSILSGVSSNPGNPIRVALEKMRNDITADAVDGATDLKILHNVKLQIDDIINNTQDSSIGNTVRSSLTQANRALVSAMEQASPQYDAVKELFAEASGPINELQESLVGQIATIPNERLKRVLPSIFDATQSNPTVLANAKSVIDSVDPEAWQHLTRAYFDTKIGQLSTRAVEGVPNIPAQLRGTIFGRNQVQERMIMQSLTPEQRQSASWLMRLLDATARGRAGGSDTAGKTEAIRQIRDGGLEQYLNPLSWGRGLTSAISQARFERRAQNFVRLMTDDNWSAEMAKLQELNPSDSASGRALVQLLTRMEQEQFEGMDEGTGSNRQMPAIQLDEAVQ